jgi:predicted nucleic acid-binding Zn ribbon protein
VPKTEQWDTMTRSQLLTERGYPAETMNGSTPEGRNGSVSTAAERECAVCGEPIPPERPVNSPTCSDKCRDEWRLAGRRRRHAESREAPGSILELVARTGAELVSVELTLGGERWLLTRQVQTG